jgi:hypothetical protein
MQLLSFARVQALSGESRMVSKVSIPKKSGIAVLSMPLPPMLQTGLYMSRVGPCQLSSTAAAPLEISSGRVRNNQVSLGA